jgi:diacylglycerol kinase (ATP)
MNQYSKKGLSRLFAAFTNSVKGFTYLIKNEAAFKQEIVLSCLLIPVIFFIDVGNLEKLLLFFSIIFVLITEVINTAIEITINRIGVEHNYLSGLAKDLGSLSVLMSLIFAVVVWAVVNFSAFCL